MSLQGHTQNGGSSSPQSPAGSLLMGTSVSSVMGDGSAARVLETLLSLAACHWPACSQDLAGTFSPLIIIFFKDSIY